LELAFAGIGCSASKAAQAPMTKTKAFMPENPSAVQVRHPPAVAACHRVALVGHLPAG
jgi:hypothetical protein